MNTTHISKQSAPEAQKKANPPQGRVRRRRGLRQKNQRGIKYLKNILQYVSLPIVAKR